jgi:hypothetical protein
MDGSSGGNAASSRLTPEELHLRAVAGAHTSWAHTEDRTQRTSNGRKAFDQRFYEGIPDDLPPKEREKRAKSARQAYFAGLALKAATAARKRREGGESTRSPQKAGPRWCTTPRTQRTTRSTKRTLKRLTWPVPPTTPTRSRGPRCRHEPPAPWIAEPTAVVGEDEPGTR